MKRRHFLKNTAGATTALLMSKLSGFASSLTPNNTNAGYTLNIMATGWGFTGTLDELCAKAKAANYNGIEMWWPNDKKGQDDLFAALKKHQLEIGFLVAGSESNITSHLDTFKKMIDAAAHNTEQRPLYVNCHSGRDYFTYNENKLLIDHTLLLAKETGLRISHETHRSRMLYSAPIARNFIETIPDLRITFDVSHWCNVHETLLHDQQQTIDMTLPRVDLIHARIGHPEGPQVNDPRAPEWEKAVKAHFGWWDAVVQMKKDKGEPITFLTEFGPPDYMPTEPYTRKPLSDQWAINIYMKDLLQKRYS